MPTLTNFRGKYHWMIQRAWHKRGVQLGADGSVVRDGDWVYVLALNIPLDERINQIDYFDGWSTAQMNDEYESDIPQRVMIPLCYHTAPGILTRRIIAIQRLGRKTWVLRLQSRIVKLAELFLDLYARARREGIVIPSLDYEQKLASRRYGGVWKYQRALVREHKHRLRLRELAAGREPCISTFICAVCETRCDHYPVGDSLTQKCKQCCGAMLEVSPTRTCDRSWSGLI